MKDEDEQEGDQTSEDHLQNYIKKEQINKVITPDNKDQNQNDELEVEQGMVLKDEEVSRLHVTSQNVSRYLKGPRNGCKKQACQKNNEDQDIVQKEPQEGPQEEQKRDL